MNQRASPMFYGLLNTVAPAAEGWIVQLTNLRAHKSLYPNHHEKAYKKTSHKNSEKLCRTSWT